MKTVVAVAVLLISLCSASAQTKTAQAWDENNIKWQEINPDGTKYSVLEGRRDLPGQSFTYAFFIPAGYWEHHWHTQDARVAVIKGALRVSFGETLDKIHAQSYPVGSFLLVPANVKHTMGADVDTIIIGTAVGPWSTKHNAEQGHRH
jgi:quercetin dioxygenase-like cupin family protein